VRVLHVTQGYHPTIGGTEWLIQQVSERLVREHADEVTVFTTNCWNGEGFFTPALPTLPVGWSEVAGVRVRRFPVHSRVSALLRKPQERAYRHRLPGNENLRAWAQGPLITGLERAIREFPSDIVVASSFPLLHMFAALRAAHASGRPCVLIGALHPQDDWGFGRAMIYRAIREADAYVAFTVYEAEHVIRRGADPRRVHVIGLGVDPAPHEGISRDEARRRYGLEGGPVVGFIGQLGHHKGVDTLLRAMPAVWRSVPAARLLLAGARTGFSGQIATVLADWPGHRRSKVSLVTNFSEEEKASLFAALDVFVYPSGYESFGIAFLEAWVAGKPVIGCFRGAVPWVVDAGRDGLLVDFQDDIKLAAAVVLLLENRRWARALGEAGRAKALARHTWSEVTDHFRRVYEDQVPEPSSH